MFLLQGLDAGSLGQEGWWSSNLPQKQLNMNVASTTQTLKKNGQETSLDQWILNQKLESYCFQTI